MVKKIVIFGTGGNCLDILDAIREINKIERTYECVGFLDDNAELLGSRFHDLEVLGPLNRAKDLKDSCFFVNGIGSQKNFIIKDKIISKTQVSIERFETIIHPTAVVSNTSVIGRGVVVLQNVTIASNVVVGNHVMILPNSVISHDDQIEDYTCIAGGVCISGGVRIGEGCYLGSNCSIIENIHIGKHSLIGMGSVVIKPVPENSVMVGSPAKFLRKIM
jgi:sugar O-acyltransferase (sialic acid O-acetyltransferase NeuD family)